MRKISLLAICVACAGAPKIAFAEDFSGKFECFGKIYGASCQGPTMIVVQGDTVTCINEKGTVDTNGKITGLHEFTGCFKDSVKVAKLSTNWRVIDWGNGTFWAR